MRIHHVGYLVQNIQNAVDSLLLFGGELQGTIIFDKDRNIDIAFVKNGEVLIELVSPREGNNDIGKSLLKIGNTPYHLCYECENINDTIDGLRENGCIVVKEPKEAVAIDGKKVAFLYSSSLGLFELVEK